jgi:hypothetical protein
MDNLRYDLNAQLEYAAVLIEFEELQRLNNLQLQLPPEVRDSLLDSWLEEQLDNARRLQEREDSQREARIREYNRYHPSYGPPALPNR